MMESAAVKIRSLRFKLIVMSLAISLIPVLVIGTISFRRAERALKEQMISNFKALVEAKEGALAAYFAEKLKRGIAFGGDYYIQTMLERVSGNDPASPQLLVSVNEYLLKKKLPIDAETYEIFILDPDGKIIASTEQKNLGLERPLDEYFTEGKKGAHFKDVYTSDVTGKTGFAISAPIRDATGRKLLGVIVSRYGTEGFTPLITNTNLKTGYQTQETYLVNRDGFAITELRNVKDAVLQQRIDTEPVRAFRDQRRFSAGVYKDYRGQAVVGVAMGDTINELLGAGWLIIAEIDEAEALAPVHRLRMLIGMTFLIVALLVIVITFFLAARITAPLQKLSAVAQEIAGGDLTPAIAVTSSDEIGLLAGNFREMVKSLRDLIAKSQDAIRQMTAASTEILAASQQQAAAAREQSSAVSETTSAAQELSTTSEQVGEAIKRVSQVAGHTLAGMAKLRETMTKSSQLITSLGEKSREIGKITEVIDDVADQTNLLAVNASIEAARAGEQGRGFSVVADEIRKLADSTAKSTKDITALIEVIQHEMSNAIIAMEQSTHNIDDEAKLAQQTADSAKEIAMNATQQVSGSRQIAEAMGSIDEAMKQIATGAQQSQVAAKQLTQLAHEIEQLTKRFKLV